MRRIQAVRLDLMFEIIPFITVLKLFALKGGAFRHGVPFILYPLTPP